MSTMAVSARGVPLFSESFNEDEWVKLKSEYQVGDITMLCCGAPAVPKTSANGLQFFAHYSDECSTAPESVWHVATKELIARELLKLGVTPYLEKPIPGKTPACKADVYFEFHNRKIAVEVQHSYQTLSEYFGRQTRYVQHKLECYWVVYPNKYMTLAKSLVKYRIKTEFGGSLPPNGSPCVPDLPIVYFSSSEAEKFIGGAGFFRSTMTDWLKSLLDRRFVFQDGIWVIIPNMTDIDIPELPA